jgi:quercetin dioxygenase-like cupin family protein
MTKFLETEEKGIRKCLVEDGLEREKLKVHVTRIEGGGRSHPSHVHAGAEAFLILEGRAIVEAEGERIELGSRELIVLDATKPHGISNAGDEPVEYIVITTK